MNILSQASKITDDKLHLISHLFEENGENIKDILSTEEMAFILQHSSNEAKSKYEKTINEIQFELRIANKEQDPVYTIGSHLQRELLADGSYGWVVVTFEEDVFQDGDSIAHQVTAVRQQKREQLFTNE
tara:strand:- start:24604 stop:24990 length:387 start_codon:yes stop_codon:yes gene_type:complete